MGESKTKPSLLLRDPKRQPVLLTTPVSTLFLWVGLFTVSWDKFFQVHLGSFNLKLPVIAFAASAVLTALDQRKKGNIQLGHPVITAALWVLVAFMFAGLFANDRVLALIQLATIITGALPALLACVWNTRLHGNVNAALTAFIRGGVVASVFGLYQLFAFYTGLPQGMIYRATSGGMGRISSFSYEAGYFGYFVALVIAALFARAHIRNVDVNKWQLLFFVAVMILANSRATVFVLPLLVVLLLFRRPSSSVKAKLVPIIFFGMVFLGLAWAAFPAFFEAFAARAATVFDLTEQTSNAPRLNSFAIAWELIQQNPIVGIGGGNLRDESAILTGVVDDRLSSNEVIANNVWLQSLLDGGIVLLVAEAAMILSAAVHLYRRKAPAARFLAGGWLTVLLVSSIITSYFFDVKLWAVLGLAVAVAGYGPREEEPKPIAASRRSSLLVRSASGSRSSNRSKSRPPSRSGTSSLLR